VLFDFVNDVELRGIATDWEDRVDVVTATPHAVSAESGLADTDAVLVRPDGYVAWAAPGCGTVTAALRRWFGAPLPH
jgi:bifunctional hydroxylase/dehydrase